jgi:cell division protein FtsB
MSSLTDRIALVLQAEASPEAIAAILEDAQAELLDVKGACTAAQAQVLDPLSNSATVTKAKRELDDLTLQTARLEAAVHQLASQLAAAHACEAEAARSKLYEAARTERDTLVDDIRRIYPEAASAIAALIVRIAAADEKIAAVNQALPDGAAWLEYPEQIARSRPPHEGSPLSRSVKLPALLDRETYWNSFWPAGRQ